MVTKGTNVAKRKAMYNYIERDTKSMLRQAIAMGDITTIVNIIRNHTMQQPVFIEMCEVCISVNRPLVLERLIQIYPVFHKESVWEALITLMFKHNNFLSMGILEKYSGWNLVGTKFKEPSTPNAPEPKKKKIAEKLYSAIESFISKLKEE